MQRHSPKAQRLYITWVHTEIEGDAFFPKWKESDFREISRDDRAEGAGHPAFSFSVLERKV